MWFVEEASQFSVGLAAQSLTCSIMEKPHAWLDDCLNMLLSCCRKRMSASIFLSLSSKWDYSAEYRVGATPQESDRAHRDSRNSAPSYCACASRGAQLRETLGENISLSRIPTGRASSLLLKEAADCDHTSARSMIMQFLHHP